MLRRKYLGLILLGFIIVSGVTFSLGSAEKVESDAAPISFEALMELGEETYAQHCAKCHGSDGIGISGPSLGTLEVESASRIVRQVLFGSDRMPSFGNALTDAEVAAVTSYIRGSFGNDLDPIDAEAVAEVKSQFQ